MTTCIAHRGWSGKAPENTMAAFELALNEPKIYSIELDIHLSKDNVPVVIHDYTIDRTTDGKGFVSDYTAEELAAFDAGQWFSPEFKGQNIPTLEEVIELVKGKKKLLIELKQMGARYPKMEEKVVELIQKHELHDEVVIMSFDHESAKKVKELDGNIEIGITFIGRPTMLEEQLAYTGATHLSLHHGYMTEEFMEQLRQLNVEVGVWTVDDAESIDRIQNIDPTIFITTNHPVLLV